MNLVDQSQLRFLSILLPLPHVGHGLTILLQFMSGNGKRMILQTKKKKLTQGDITEQYAEVYIHLKEKGDSSFIKANKVILAFHSSYFHRIFQSRGNMQTVDFAFIGIGADVVKETISMMYGSNLTISKNELAKFKMFFNMLEMNFGVSEDDVNPVATLKRPSTVEGELAEKNAYNEMESPTHELSSPRRKKAMPTTSTTSFAEKTPVATKHSPVPSPREPFDSTIETGQQPEPSHSKPSKIITEKTSDTSNETSHSKETKPSSKACKITDTYSGTSWYTTRGGAPASIDNWTETTEDGLQDRLVEIEFKLGLTPNGHHKDYICCNCHKIVKAFSVALAHFEEVHKKCDEEISLLREAMKYQKEAVQDIGKLQTQIDDGCIKELADNQLR